MWNHQLLHSLEQCHKIGSNKKKKQKQLIIKFIYLFIWYTKIWNIKRNNNHLCHQMKMKMKKWKNESKKIDLLFLSTYKNTIIKFNLPSIDFLFLNVLFTLFSTFGCWFCSISCWNSSFSGCGFTLCSLFLILLHKNKYEKKNKLCVSL